MNILLTYPDLPIEQKRAVEQQVHRAPYVLAVEELRHLRDAGFPFGSFKGRWIDQYLDLAQHLADGHNPAHPPARRLGMWMRGQRQKRRDGRLEPGREQALNRLGFSWEIQEERWLKVFAQFYRRQRVGGKVPFKLANWARKMRQDWDDLPAYQ